MWKVYRIEMPAVTRVQYMAHETDETRGYARSLVVIGNDACVEIGAFETQADARTAARAEFDRTGRSCIVRELAADKNERRW